jgi:hypothetical protein
VAQGKRRNAPAPASACEVSVTVPYDDYRRMSSMATAARRAYDVLTAEQVTSDDITGLAWELWRAIEGRVPMGLQ